MRSKELQPVQPAADPWAETHPHARYDPEAARQYEHIVRPHRSRRWKLGCLLVQLSALGLLVLLLAYFVAPIRTNLLILGNDARPEEGDLGRTDTMILASINPLRPDVQALSIPRDLWVEIPGQGLQRINTAHFYGEAEEEGKGPQAAIEAVDLNFGVEADYYVRIRFDGFQEIVDALGGIDIELSEPMSGYTAGTHHLNGEQALALVRDRAGSDDFARMSRAQIFMKAVLKQMLKPQSWVKLPGAFYAMVETMDSNVPLWQYPRLGLALLRAGADGINGRTITREMVNPATTEGGANVLVPRWELIDPVIEDMFGVRHSGRNY